MRDSREDAALRQWLRSRERPAISAIAWAEFLCGPVDPRVAEIASSLLGDPLPFGPDEAALAAELFNAAGRRRGTFVDCMVVAVAMVGDASFVTANVADFARFEPRGLRLLRY